MSEKLEPCPFCGCAVGLVTGFEYSTVRGDHALTCVFLDDEPVATAAEWNSRAQRDEGLAREAACREIAENNAQCVAEGIKREEALQQRLAEAEKLVGEFMEVTIGGFLDSAHVLRARRDAEAFLASPGCADGEPDFKSDQNAVEIFSKLMLHKLAKKSAEGRSGWQECSQERLTRMLREHVEKGDPVDVANFCMMLCANGMSIGPGCADGEKAE